jgi:hypothetical protein
MIADVCRGKISICMNFDQAKKEGVSYIKSLFFVCQERRGERSLALGTVAQKGYILSSVDLKHPTQKYREGGLSCNATRAGQQMASWRHRILRAVPIFLSGCFSLALAPKSAIGVGLRIA